MIYFSTILSREQDFILENISLNKGIAKIKSLKENIFLLFVALVTNIPLIIKGKPGSSKTLSAQLITKEMEGKFSRKKFFKFYPSIIQTYFQCTETTTPEDIEEVFIKAKIKLEGLKKDNVTDLPISMILLENLELAQNSKNNPLKALNSFLEYGGNNEGISFVGISNLTLDVSKINRALCLSVPDLDNSLDDLRMTSMCIARSINDYFSSNKIFNKILPNVYYQFKENLKILKKLMVYKKYELQEYKYLINKYKDNEDFQKIFYDIEECKSFFDKNKNERKEKDLKIYEYDIFKKVKNKLKKFYKEETLLNNKEFKRLYEEDKQIKLDFFGNNNFYNLIKGIANEMNDNNADFIAFIGKYIERNFGGSEIKIDYEKDYYSLDEFQKYKHEVYQNFFEKLSSRETWSSAQIFAIIYNIYCEYNDEPEFIIDEEIIYRFLNK